MNRTILLVLFACLCSAAPGPAQEQKPPPEKVAEADPIEGIVTAMRAAEQRARSFRIELTTRGHLPSGLDLATKGTLHVLRGTQPAMHSAVEVRYGDGFEGRIETAQTQKGIWILEENPAFGEVFLHVDDKVMADLEWAGEVLLRADLPGMADRRAQSPLGSAMVDDLRRHFALQVTDRRERNGEAGRWLAGPRRPGLADLDPELPLPDRVELFVRDKDQALLEVVQHQGKKELQRITVVRLEVDVEIPAATFQVDGRGLRLREVQQYPPMWEQIEKALQQAEAKSAEGVVRPSLRK